MDANINTSINILNRKYDKDIKLITSYKEVKSILENRLKTKNKEEIINLI